LKRLAHGLMLSRVALLSNSIYEISVDSGNFQ
jgi:hypothetical protein